MAIVRKKISELTTLNSGSVNTTVLGIDSGTTYKIELNVLANTVASRISSSTTLNTGSFATTGSNTFYGNQIISGSGVNTILQVHGANAEPWAFGIYNDTYNLTQSVLAGFVDNTGEANIGTEVDKPLYIYTNATYNAPTLIISSSGVTFKDNILVNGITVGRGKEAAAENTAVGLNVLKLNNGGAANVAVGERAMEFSVSGEYNTAVGYYSLTSTENALGNTAIGYQTLMRLPAGYSYNTAVGYNAGYNLLSGQNNIFLGIFPEDGLSLVNASNNTIIGSNIVGLSSSLNNNIILADGQGNIKYRWDGTKNIISDNLIVSGSQTISGSLITTNGITGSIAATNGVISGSSQLTSSYDIRYALSGSGGSIPTGTISGSSQLTSSFDLRYLITGSVTSSITLLNSFTASNSTTLLNAATASYSTTGSNIFKSDQTISGSVSISGSLTIPNLTLGSVIFAGTNGIVSQSNSNFFWDNTNGRLGIGIAVPLFGVHCTSGVRGNALYAATAATIGGTTTANASAVIDIISTTKGLLPPRTNLTSNIATPAQGLITYLTGSTNEGLYYYDSGSIKNWTRLLNDTGSQIISGSLTTTNGITGSIAATNGVVSGSSQLTTAFPSKTTGAWSVPAGASTQSFSVESGASYTMWVNGNIPNGIITWNATVTTANTNVPAVGSQYGWYYTPGNALVLTAIPDQIIGTNGSIATTPTSYASNTSNVFKFGITNNSGTTQTINYGYIKLS